MDDPGDIPQESQQDVEPELPPKADLQEYAERRKKNCNDDSNDVHWRFISLP